MACTKVIIAEGWLILKFTFLQEIANQRNIDIFSSIYLSIYLSLFTHKHTYTQEQISVSPYLFSLFIWLVSCLGSMAYQPF